MGTTLFIIIIRVGATGFCRAFPAANLSPSKQRISSMANDFFDGLSVRFREEISKLKNG
jgi:hypothetical protein